MPVVGPGETHVTVLSQLTTTTLSITTTVCGVLKYTVIDDAIFAKGGRGGGGDGGGGEGGGGEGGGGEGGGGSGGGGEGGGGDGGDGGGGDGGGDGGGGDGGGGSGGGGDGRIQLIWNGADARLGKICVLFKFKWNWCPGRVGIANVSLSDRDAGALLYPYPMKSDF